MEKVGSSILGKLAMAFDDLVEAVRNAKTGKLFVVIDELGSRYRLITPEGTFVSLAVNLFDDETIVLESSQAREQLTPEQLRVFSTHVQEQVEKAELDAKARKQVRERKSVESSPPRAQSRRGSPKKSLKDQLTGIGATWQSSTLAFYRPQIENLGPKQSFKVQVHGLGTFIMTRTDFQNVFSDVVLDDKYKRDGFFQYREIPEKAMRFLKRD